jgi:hypothetical protein
MRLLPPHPDATRLTGVTGQLSLDDDDNDDVDVVGDDGMLLLLCLV